jgi:hypothetical protein
MKITVPSSLADDLNCRDFGNTPWLEVAKPGRNAVVLPANRAISRLIGQSRVPGAAFFGSPDGTAYRQSVRASPQHITDKKPDQSVGCICGVMSRNRRHGTVDAARLLPSLRGSHDHHDASAWRAD